jgi:ADP-heptose:LPS heptosyltransferase
MKTAILLSYKGIGANLLHLTYCHEIAKKYGPISIITICPKLSSILKDDPLIREVICLENYYKKFLDIFKLAKFLKSIKIENIFIFYPSIRYYLSSKLAGIKNIKQYPFFKKKNLHLVQAAKKLTENILGIENCPTETKISLNSEKINKYKLKNFKIITLGVGSSGPSTRWGEKNFVNLILNLNKKDNYFFYLLCGPNEREIADRIINQIEKKNCISLGNIDISEAIYYISASSIYIGNDSFGHHVAAQRNIPSFIIMLDTPRAYTDYSINQNKILPKNISENEIDHDSNFNPNSISVDMVLDKIKKFI